MHRNLLIVEAKAPIFPAASVKWSRGICLITRHGKAVAALIQRIPWSTWSASRRQAPREGLPAWPAGGRGPRIWSADLRGSNAPSPVRRPAADQASLRPHPFDPDAISELLRPRPSPDYVEWLRGVPLEDQFTSAVVIGELYREASRSPARECHLANIRQRLLPAVGVFARVTCSVAEVCGLLSAQSEELGHRLLNVHLQIAATAVYHNLELVSGNLRHFARIPQLQCNPILAKSRRS